MSERNTWPKLAQTHAHCDVEVTLERCVQRQRLKLKHEAAAERMHHITSVQQLSSLNGSNGSLSGSAPKAGGGMSSGCVFTSLGHHDHTEA